MPVRRSPRIPRWLARPRDDEIGRPEATGRPTEPWRQQAELASVAQFRDAETEATSGEWPYSAGISTADPNLAVERRLGERCATATRANRQGRQRRRGHASRSRSSDAASRPRRIWWALLHDNHARGRRLPRLRQRGRSWTRKGVRSSGRFDNLGADMRRVMAVVGKERHALTGPWRHNGNRRGP